MTKGGDKDSPPAKPTAEIQRLIAATEEPAQVQPTDEPAPTAEPATAELPTAEPPTAEPPTAVPATAVPVPPTEALPPTEASPPTEVPAPRPDVDPGKNVNCSSFSGHSEAQAWWDYWHARGFENPGRLDGNDNDGDVCESS